MFRRMAAAAAVFALCFSASFAQTSSTTPSTQPANQRLVSGANSFTEAQAQDRMEKAGFTEVKGLTKDGQGIWRGTAMKSGKQVNVALDFQGNIAANP
jgi:putative membrane protein